MFRKRAAKPDTGPRAPFISLIKKGAVYGLLGTSILLIYSRFHKSDLQFTFEPTDSNVKIIEGCRQLRRGVYYPTFFLPFAFGQYLFSRLFEKNIYTKVRQQKLENLQTLKWMPVHTDYQDNNKTSIVLVVAGCKGLDVMMDKALLATYRKGFRAVAYEPKQFANQQELQAVVEHLKKKYPEAKLYGLGVEYGANLLVLHAAKSGKKLYDGLVSIGNPLDLEKSERNIKGLWKLTLEKQLIACRSKKANLQEQPSTLYDVDLHQHHLKPQQLASFKQSISSINSIKDLETQTLFLNSLTDPFSLRNLSQDDRIQNSKCMYVQTRSGGHQQWYESSRTMRWIFKPAVQFLVYLDRHA